MGAFFSKKKPTCDALKLKGSVLVVAKRSRGGYPLEHLSLTNLSWRVFGVIQNPSGFGVFRQIPILDFKGFG